MKTECHDCCFASPGKCRWGLPEKLNTIITQDNDGYNILDRVCVFGRPHKWLKRHKENTWKDLRKEVTIKYSATIIVNKIHTVNDILITLNNLQEHQLKCSHISVIINGNIKLISPIKNLLDINKVPYNLEFILDDSTDEDCMCLAAQKTQYRWNLVLLAGGIVQPNYTILIDTLLNTELERFVAVLPEDCINGSFIQSNVINNIEYLRENKEWVINKSELLSRVTTTEDMQNDA